MSGGWVGSTHRARLPADWPAIRRAVLERDGHRCMWPTPDGVCGAPASDGDHVEAMTDSHQLADLQALCRPHRLAPVRARRPRSWPSGRDRGPQPGVSWGPRGR